MNSEIEAKSTATRYETHGSHLRAKSQFAARSKKKAKTQILDHTVLQEAVSCSSACAAVLGHVVERSVPPLELWDKDCNCWPCPEPHGNPQPFLIPYQQFKCVPGKSLYRQFLESQSSNTDCIADLDAMDVCPTRVEVGSCTVDVMVQQSSNGGSAAVCGVDVLEGGVDEAAQIHSENLSRLAQLTSKEIQRERELILAQCDPALVHFVRSMRERRVQAETAGIGVTNSAASGVTDGAARTVTGKAARPVTDEAACVVTDEAASAVTDEAASAVTDEAASAVTDGAASAMIGKVASVVTDGGISAATTTMADSSSDASDKDYRSKIKEMVDTRKRVQFQFKTEPSQVAVVPEDGLSCESTMDTDKVDTSDLPIPLAEAKKWLNMDKVELHKMRWTMPLRAPLPLLSRDLSFVARFAFDGTLLPYDAEVDTRAGLHHHGEEPERAGYTLDELFVLSRSAVSGQRQRGLATLASILRQQAAGHFFQCFQTSLLKIMLDAGFVLLVRFALDDGVPAVREAAVGALAALLAADEAVEGGLSVAEPWAGGLRPGVASSMHAQQQVRTELNAEESELKDVELLQLDVVRALIRVDTLVRLRYLIECLPPSAECVLHLTGILTRIASHSLTAAWKICSCPRLLQCLLERYLPHDISALLTGENVTQRNNVDGVPLRHVLTLLKVLCSWGRHLSSELVNKHALLSRLLSYVSLEPTEVSMPLSEALRLAIEAYAVWGVLLGYGLSQAQEALLSFYPLLLRQLHFYRDKVSLNEDTGSNQLNFDLGTQLVYMLSRTLSIAATQTLLQAQLQQHASLKVGLDSKSSEALQAPLIAWENLKPVIELLLVCCSKWFVQLQRARTTFSGLKLLGTTCLFVENYIRKCKDQRGYLAGKYLCDIEKLYNATLLPFLQCDSFTELLSHMRFHSALCSGLQSSAGEDPKNLATLNTVTLSGKVTPLLLPSSPFPLLLPLSSLLCTMHSLHPSLSHIPTFIDHPQVIKYLEILTSTSTELSLRSQWFTRIEAEFLANMMRLSTQTSTTKPVLYHRAALVTITCLQKGQENLAKELLSEVICNSSGVQDLTELSTQVNSIALNDYEPLKSPALFQQSLAPLQLTTKLLCDLPAVGSVLVTSLLDSTPLKESAVWRRDIPFLINTMTISHSESNTIFDEYWPLMLLKKEMIEKIIKIRMATEKATKNPNRVPSELFETSDQSKPELIISIGRSLEMTYLCLKYRSDVTMKMSNITGWLRHISLTFLIANDLFLDHTVNSYLQGCLREILFNDGYRCFNDKLEFPGLGNTFDWYKKLVEQYIAVSYGDSTFALLLLLPTLQVYPITFRALLWGDLSDALPLIRLRADEVEKFFPFREFMEPEELDEEMLCKYRSSVLAGLITKTRTPLLWAIAHHHMACADTRNKTRTTEL